MSENSENFHYNFPENRGDSSKPKDIQFTEKQTQTANPHNNYSETIMTSENSLELPFK